MTFQQWLNESSYNQLYQSAVQAFPFTTRRQHATGPIAISEIKMRPYVKTRSLFTQAEADNSEGGKYKPIIMFKDVQYWPGPGPGVVEIVASDGNQYFLSQLSSADNNVLVRCPCADFFWRFNFYNSRENPTALYGNVREPYEAVGGGPPANPLKMPGLCKHVIRFFDSLKDVGLVDN